MRPPMRQGAFAFLLLVFTFAIVAPRSWAQEPAESARKILLKTPANYPTLAHSMNIRGVVKLEALVAPNGFHVHLLPKAGNNLHRQQGVASDREEVVVSADAVEL